MKTETIEVRVSTNGPSRMGKDWGTSILSKMRKYAATHGAAGWAKQDGSYVLIHKDKDGKLRRTTWKKARIVK